MNLKNLFNITLGLLISSLMFISCNQDKPKPDETKPLTETALVGNCKRSDMSASVLTWTSGQATPYKGATTLKINKLRTGGDKIVGVRVYVPEVEGDVTVFAGSDKDNPAVTKTAPAVEAGWQHILFDEPLELTTEDVVIGFSVSSIGLALEEASSTQDDIFVDNKWQKLSALAGKYVFALQAVMTGGDYSDRTQVDMVADQLVVERPWAVKGETTSALVLVRNNGVKTVNGVKVSVALAGGTAIEQTISDSIMNGQSKLLTINNIPVAGDGSQELKAVVSVEKDNVTKNNTLSEVVRVYADAGMKRNTILLEQFTSQQCPNCPRGAEYLKASIDAMSNKGKITWVAHHKGYYDDAFSIEESQAAATAMGVRSAPAGSLNRMMLNLEGTPALNWYLGLPSPDVLDGLVEEPANASLKLERSYNADTRELTVTVSGKSVMADNNVTVLVTQSGMMAGQGGATGKYEHNFAPRFYLTAGAGDKVEVDGEGNYTVTVKKTVPESVGDFECVLEDMEVVVFIHGATTAKADARFVYNADKLPLVEADPAAILHRVLSVSANIEVTEDLLLAPRAVCVAE